MKKNLKFKKIHFGSPYATLSYTVYQFYMIVTIVFKIFKWKSEKL